MTIINLALTRDRALIVADSMVQGPSVRDFVTKPLPLPHLGMVVAGNGHYFILKAAQRAALEPMPADANVTDFAATMPEYLADVWRAMYSKARVEPTGGSCVILIGSTPEGAIRCFALESPDFAARELEPGLYLQPKITRPSRPAREKPAQPSGADPQPVELPPWDELVYSARAACRIQVEQAEVPIGGHQIEVLIEPWLISTARHGEF